MMAEATKTVASDSGDKSGASVRRGGRNFMVAFYAALRAIKLYPLEHSAVQKTLLELIAKTRSSQRVGGSGRKP